MYIENYEFKEVDAKTARQVGRSGQRCKVFAEQPRSNAGDKLLDNQDLCLLFRVSTRTLQRLRAKKKLPFMMISGKAYYRASDVREFIRERFDVDTLRKFEKEHGENKQ